MAMTGGLGPNGQSALLAQKIWEEDINAKGGLLGRPVKLIYYDDQSNPSTVPGIYAKLLDVDKVDLIIGGYATNMLAPAMPLVIQRKKMFIGLLGLAVNSEFHYPNYFVITPGGPEPKLSFTKGFFDVAVAQNPKPTTVAIISADAEFARNAADGARENAARAGLKIVYDKTYPPPTADFAPIVRAIAATNPDIVVICSYPPNSVGMVRAVNEIGFKPKMIGGGMVGLQNTSIKTQLGPLLNGFTNYDFWLPVPKMLVGGVEELMKKYQARAAGRRRGPAGLLHGAPGLHADAGAAAGHRSHQEPRRQQARRLHPRHHVQDRARRREVRQGWRVGGAARAAGAVPEREGQRPHAVQGRDDPGGGRARGLRIRQGHLPLREGEVAGRVGGGLRSCPPLRRGHKDDAGGDAREKSTQSAPSAASSPHP